MARTDPQINFRISQDLKERLETAALENKRTLTAELSARLEESLAHRDGKDSAQGDLEVALNTQLRVTNAGLRLAELATKFLELEVPAVRNTDSFRMLVETVDVSLKVAPEDLPPTSSESLDAASKAMNTYQSAAEKLGVYKMIEALDRSSSPLLDAKASPIGGKRPSSARKPKG